MLVEKTLRIFLSRFKIESTTLWSMKKMYHSLTLYIIETFSWKK